MKVTEFNELIDPICGKEFATLNVIMDNSEEAEFNDGTIYYNARGYYYYLMAHGYKISNTRTYSDSMQYTVTIFCKRITFIDCT